MVAVIGVTNAMDKKGVAAAVSGKAEMPRLMILDDQLSCVCKARKGEGRNIPVSQDFRYQRFKARKDHFDPGNDVFGTIRHTPRCQRRKQGCHLRSKGRQLVVSHEKG